ncbi:MAG TPA: GreA/GreB family elongation factor [Kiritimatiellia bacterium]|nr:GreA/GreB family elongation factor [Kiritimatiellia bacterium]
MADVLGADQIEQAITSQDCDWASVGTGLIALYKSGSNDQADLLAEQAVAILTEQAGIDGLLHIFEAQAYAKDKAPGGISWAQRALAALGGEWEHKALVEQAGFDTGVPSDLCFRRLKLLRALKEGAVCYDKTWGIGVVGKIDYFYKRVDIDFQKKRGHQLALSYASEKLLLLDDSHIFYWKHQKPVELAEKIKSSPGEVVKLAIRSFGPLSAIQLQERLVPQIVEEKQWKTFWENARKQLKADKLVQIPTNRKDAIRLIEAAEGDDVSHDLNGLVAERNLETLAQRFEEIADEVGSGGLTEQQRNILQDRLAFIVKGAWPRQPTLLVRAKMAAVSLGVDEESKPELAAIKKFFDADTFMETLKKLPVKHSAMFLRYLSAHDKAKLDQMILSLMTKMDIGSLAEVINYLIEQGREKDVADIFRAAVDTREPGIEILSWLSRSMDKVGAWSLGHMYQILNFMIDEIEKNYSADQLKAQNQLKERWTKSDWMKSALAQLDGHQREALTMRVKNSSGWTVLDKQSQLATIVKLYPDLEELMARSSRQEQAKPKGPMTSIRSYEERKEQLQRIINVEIPKVAKEIALAREYGDLRENFEYKAAKDAQALLFRRRDEIGAMLTQVTPSDFKDMPTDRAGLATAVEVTYGDGRAETFYLLGEWDSDPTRNIISSSSRMAQVLNGHVPGDSLMIPTEQGEATCTITGVNPLPDTIRLWIERKQ